MLSLLVFMLSKREWANLKTRIVISSWGGVRRATPNILTGQDTAMFSGVLSEGCSHRRAGESDKVDVQ